MKNKRKGFWRWAIVACASVGILSSTGCGTISGYQQRPEPHASVRKARRELYFGLNADKPYHDAAAGDRQKIRDELVYGKMQVLEDDFQDLERSLNSAGNSVSLGGDLIAIVLNGVAATAGSATSKSALSAASGGIVGAQGAINKDLYYQKTLPALISQMQANRAAASVTIVQNLKQADAAYPLNAAEIDLQHLIEAGSLVTALNDISQQATQQKKGSEAQIQNLRDLTFATSDSATKLQAWLYPNGSVDAAHLHSLQDWLNRQPEPFLNGQGYPPAAFVSGDTGEAALEPIRQRAIADPALGIPH